MFPIGRNSATSQMTIRWSSPMVASRFPSALKLRADDCRSSMASRIRKRTDHRDQFLGLPFQMFPVDYGRRIEFVQGRRPRHDPFAERRQPPARSPDPSRATTPVRGTWSRFVRSAIPSEHGIRLPKLIIARTMSCYRDRSLDQPHCLNPISSFPVPVPMPVPVTRNRSPHIPEAGKGTGTGTGRHHFLFVRPVVLGIPSLCHRAR